VRADRRATPPDRDTLAIVLGEVLGIVVQVVLWSQVPHWYAIGLLILYPLGVWIGSNLRRPQAAAVA
jgi:hypothetical protein